MEIQPLNLCNRTIAVTFLLSLFLTYCLYILSTCSSIVGWRRSASHYSPLFNESSLIQQQQPPSNTEMPEITILGSIVRIVPLTGFTLKRTNVSDVSPKYRLLQERVSPQSHLPGALLIGVKKSGTRALLEFVRLHPGVRASGCEVHFFDKHYKKGIQWYRSQMPPTIEGQITMEKTPSYFITKEVPKRVHLMNPTVKLLVVVRDPVTRAISDYTQAASKKANMKRFENLAFVNASFGLVDSTWGPLRIGVYARHLERWLKYFPLSQFLFVSGERLIVDPAVEMARVQDFLGLKRVITEKHFFFNATKGFPCLLKSESRPRPHCLGKTKGRNHPIIDPAAIERLREFYKPFNAKFYTMTGISFGWP